MTMIRLVCSACRANLDVLDDGSGLASCGYCGATSRLATTTQPQPHYAVPVVGGPVASPWSQQVPVAHPPAPRRYRPWRGILVAHLVLGLAAAIIVIVANIVIGFGVPNSGQPAGGRTYRWDSASPFIADLDGDGHEEILGFVIPNGSPTRILLTAISSSNWQLLWEIEIVDSTDGKIVDFTNGSWPQLHYGPGSPVAYVVMGAKVRAHRVADGTFAWEQQFQAPIESLVHDGAQLRVALDGPADVLLDPDTGSETAITPQGSEPPIVLRDHDERRETVHRAHRAFPGLNVVASYCLADDGQELQALAFPLEHRCSATHGLAWAEQGALEYLVGYDLETQAERWRAELVMPGPTRRIETSSRVRVAVLGEDAFVGYEPDGVDARIRRFTLADGRATWETTLPYDDGPGRLSAIHATREHVYVSYVGKLYVLDASTGERERSFGSSSD